MVLKWRSRSAENASTSSADSARAPACANPRTPMAMTSTTKAPNTYLERQQVRLTQRHLVRWGKVRPLLAVGNTNYNSEELSLRFVFGWNCLPWFRITFQKSISGPRTHFLRLNRSFLIENRTSPFADNNIQWV
jgi:hypothetical protein